MKNLFRSLIALLLVLSLSLPMGMTAFGVDTTPPQTASDGSLIEPQAVDLIVTFRLHMVNIDSARFYAIADMNCVPSVVRCGIKSVVLQERKNSSEKWKTSLKLDNYLVDDYVFTKKLNFGSGPVKQLRLCVTFYAKKAWYSIQKIDYISNVITLK